MASYNMASSLETQSLEKRLFPYPYSMNPLTHVYRVGLVSISLFAMMSLISVTVLLIFITHRLISWRSHYRIYVGYNQYVILIYNLLLADLQQSIAFSISFHWLRIGKIEAPTAACFIQAWFLHIGDVASGFFVLAIAIHTWMGVVKGYKIPYKWFVASVLGIWFAALLLTVVGPALYKDRFFARAGGWCWVSPEYETERLLLHYLWVFIVEFGTIIIYAHVFFHLRGRIRSIITNDTTKLSRANKFMVLYPMAYVLLTLPIAVGRMLAMTGTEMPEVFFCIVGSMLTSCGWIDALLYTLTRRILVSGDFTTNLGHYNHTRTHTHNHTHNITAITSNAARPGDSDDFGLQSISSKDPSTATARTVTIVGGSNRLICDKHHYRHGLRSRNEDTLIEEDEEESTRTGSQDSIIKPVQLENAINIVTETNIQVEHAGELESMLQRQKSRNGPEHRGRS